MAASKSCLSQTNLIPLLSRVIRLGDQRNAADIWYLDFSKPSDNCSWWQILWARWRNVVWMGRWGVRLWLLQQWYPRNVNEQTSTWRDTASTAGQWTLALSPSEQSFYQRCGWWARTMFMMSAESKMLWATADTVNQDFKPSPLIGNERAKQARFNLTETMGESCEI